MGVRMALSNMHRIDWLADRFLPPDDSPRPNDRRREQMFLSRAFRITDQRRDPRGHALRPGGVDTPAFFAIALGFATFYVYPFLLRRVFSFRTASYLSTAQSTVLIYAARRYHHNSLSA